MPGITEKMLAQQLKELERDQLIIRTQYPEMPPRVEYSLSAFGRSLAPVLEALRAWGEDNQTQIRQVILAEGECCRVGNGDANPGQFQAYLIAALQMVPAKTCCPL